MVTPKRTLRKRTTPHGKRGTQRGWVVTIECPGQAPIRVFGRPCASGVISDARDRIEELIRWSPGTAPWLGSVSVELRELTKFMHNLNQLHWVNIWATREG